MLWWHWVVVGLALCVAEIFLPALILIWLGISAVVLGLVLLVISIPLTGQLLIWALLSSFFTFLWIRVFKPKTTDSRVGSSSEMIDETGLLVTTVEPFSKGEVLFQRPLLGADRWSCISEVSIKAGTKVRVVSIEGSVVRVAPFMSAGQA